VSDIASAIKVVAFCGLLAWIAWLIYKAETK
jgi:hypothetical protein